MKQAEHKEIDLLLRSLANRRQIDALTENSASGAHLDTDELNAYAEGVLPPSARARFSAHLADCRKCRGLVTQLTQAAGPVVSAGREKKTASFWQRLMVLFSPPVLRYAIPAMALFAVLAVSIIALRQKQGSEMVAQRQPNDVIQPKPGMLNEQPETRGLPSAPAPTRSAAESQSQNRTNTTNTTNSRLAGDRSGSADKESVEEAKETEQGGKPAAAVAQPSYAPEVAAAPPPPKKPQLEDAKTEKLAKQQEGAEREARAEPDRNEGQVRAKDEAKDDRLAASRSRSAPAGPGGIQSLRVGEATRADEKRKSQDKDQTEIRTVAGRQFRRQGNAWVDTAYSPPRATVNVSRGSEQYRALIADEPTLRVIAEQLSGEVVVVWQGRAYRIR